MSVSQEIAVNPAESNKYSFDNASENIDDLTDVEIDGSNSIDTTNSNFDHSTLDLEKQKTEAEDIEDIPDGGKDAWLVVVAVFLLNFGTWGANSGFAVYLNYDLNNNVFPGASKFDYALIGGISFGLALLFCPFINYLQGLIGTRTIMIVGNIIQFLGVFLASYSKQLWHLYLTQGVMNSIGLGFLSLSSTTLLPQWFKKKRAFASGIATAGSGVGGIIFNLGMQRVVDNMSVWWALRIQGIICLVVVSIGILLIKTRIEKRIEFTIYDKEVLSCAGFYILICFIVTCILGYVIVLYTLVASTVSLGYSAYQGSLIAAMVQVGSFTGRPLMGLLSDRFGSLTVAPIIYLFCAIFTFAMWVPANSLIVLIFYGLIMGLLMGTIYSIAPVICTRLVGLKKMNVCFSMVWTSMAAAGVCSPVIAVALTTNKGHQSFMFTTIFAGAAFAASAVSLLGLRGYIIARDTLAGKEDDPDLGQLKFRVPFYKPFYHLVDIKKV